LIRGDQDAKEAWDAIAQYNGFIADHPELYHGKVPCAKIALLSDSERDLAAESFLKGNVIFETKVLQHLDKGSPLSAFKILVAPMSLSRVKADQKQLLDDFVAAGGKIITPNRSDLAHLKAGQPAPEFLASVQAAAGPPRLTLENSGHVIANVTKDSGYNVFIIHLINYDHNAAAEGVKVKLDVSDYECPAAMVPAYVLSPDATAPTLGNVDGGNNTLSFTVDRLDHYMVIVVNAMRMR